MKSFCYFGMQNNKMKVFREIEENAVFVSGSQNGPIAFVEENTWCDWKSHKPIAFEEDEIVYDWKTRKPIFYISIE